MVASICTASCARTASAAGGYFGCTRLISSPWDTPWEILTVASEGLGTLEDADAIKPLKLWSFAEATASGLGSGGADSSPWAGVLARVVFTPMGAEFGSCVSGAGIGAVFAATLHTGETSDPGHVCSGA